MRKVCASDTDRFVVYFDGLSARSRYFYHPFAFDRASAEAVTTDLDSEDHYRIVATAERDGQEAIVGYAWLDGLTASDIPMLGIGIIDDYHERGIGKLLLRALIGVGRDRGLASIRLGVNDDNPRAIHVYESVGFRHDPTKPPQDRGSHQQIYMVCDVR